MEFDWTPAQAEFRKTLRDFIRREVPENYSEMRREGWGTSRRVEVGRSFSEKLARAGLLVRHWPEEYGGGGDGDWWNYIVIAEEAMAAGEPRGPQYMSTSWIGPALMKYGTAEQQREHLGRIREGKAIWCQGFSEPSAGSDLASMRTAAERIQGGYRINGTKIWTSYAPDADFIFLLARTSNEKKAISCFLLPMSSPGIRVQEHPGVLPRGHLNEVFFDDVFAPEGTRLGEEGRAWEVVRYVLDYERIGMPVYQHARVVLDLVVERLRAQGRFGSPFLRAHAGRVLAAIEAARHLSYAVINERAKNRKPTAIHTLARTATIQAARLMLDFMSEHLGPAIREHEGEVEDFYRMAFANAHGGGAYEIILGTVALQYLGLPRE